MPVAERLLDRLAELSADLRGAAILRSDGLQLASSDDRPWAERVNALWEAADRDASADATEIHVGTEHGEVFGVRAGEYAIVATAERFALASLMFCDLRATLRDLEAEVG